MSDDIYVYTIENEVGTCYAGFNKNTDWYPTEKGAMMGKRRLTWVKQPLTIKRYILVEDTSYDK